MWLVWSCGALVVHMGMVVQLWCNMLWACLFAFVVWFIVLLEINIYIVWIGAVPFARWLCHFLLPIHFSSLLLFNSTTPCPNSMEIHMHPTSHCTPQKVPAGPYQGRSARFAINV